MRKPRKGSFAQEADDAQAMRQRLKTVKAELQRRRYQPIPEQGRWLAAWSADTAYHAVPTNIHALQSLPNPGERHWLRSLRRRSQRHCLDLGENAEARHDGYPHRVSCIPWPGERFDVGTRGKSPVRQLRTLGFSGAPGDRRPYRDPCSSATCLQVSLSRTFRVCSYRSLPIVSVTAPHANELN